MPRGDRTGPDDAGLMTGRRMGYCAGYDEPGYTTGSGCGRMNGRGRGRSCGGRRYGRYHVSADVSEKTLLENEIRILKDQMESLEKRLRRIKEK